MYKLNNEMNLKNETSISKVLEYSEEPEKMENLLASFEVSATFKGYDKMDSMSQEVMKFNIKIKTRKDIIDFDFYQSINFTEIMQVERRKVTKEQKEEHNDFLYSVLACIGMDGLIEDNLQDFCDSFGYEIDSIKTQNLFNKCVEQKRKILSIFKESELEYFPR